MPSKTYIEMNTLSMIKEYAKNTDKEFIIVNINTDFPVEKCYAVPVGDWGFGDRDMISKIKKAIGLGTGTLLIWNNPSGVLVKPCALFTREIEAQRFASKERSSIHIII